MHEVPMQVVVLGEREGGNSSRKYSQRTMNYNHPDPFAGWNLHKANGGVSIETSFTEIYGGRFLSFRNDKIFDRTPSFVSGQDGLLNQSNASQKSSGFFEKEL